MTTRQSFIENIRLRRMVKKWTQQDLAKKAKITQAAVSQIEAGTKDPSLDTILAIAKALGIPVSKLFENLRAAS